MKKQNKLPQKISVIVTEDQTSYRQALISFLLSEKVNVIGEAVNGQELLNLLKHKKPDIIFLDIEMPVLDGREALIKIRQFDKQVKIIILSLFDSPDVIAEMKLLGANCYLDKDVDLKELLKELNKLYESDTHTNILNIVQKYTPTERQIIKLLAKGLSNADIAALRKRSVKSIEMHRRNIYTKSGCRNQGEFRLYCKNEGLSYLG